MAVTGSMGDLDFDGNTNKAATANGFFLAMPAILFSFDGFIYSTNLQNEMKEKDKKKLPKAMIISLIIICVTYISVAIMLV
jgi:amino acid transporter